MIYLDSAASTKRLLEPKADFWANASSRSHTLGNLVKHQVESSREVLASLIGVEPSNLAFTSGATESIFIVAREYPFTEVSNTAHKAMFFGHRLSNTGSSVNGLEKNYAFELINNETGLQFDSLPQKWNGIYTSDISQALTKITRIAEPCASAYLVGSMHKFHGPKGLGFVAANDEELFDRLKNPIFKGSQEFGVRPGTLNSEAIIEAGEVAKWMMKYGEEYRAKLKHLQSTFENKIKSLTDCWIIGADQERAPHITSLNLPGVDNEALIAAVNDRLAIASGSACTSEKVEPSHVLMAMFNDREIADTTVRISYGWFNTEAEVLEAAEIIAKAAETIRSFSL